MISSLPGGIDDTAPKRDPFVGMSDGDLMAEAARIQEELQKRQAAEAEASRKARFPFNHTRYLHSSKESNWNEARDEIELSDEAQRNYAYTGMEVKLTCVVEENGTCTVTHFNDVPLTKPVEI